MEINPCAFPARCRYKRDLELRVHDKIVSGTIPPICCCCVHLKQVDIPGEIAYNTSYKKIWTTGNKL